MKMETNLNAGDKLKIGIVLFVGMIALFGWYVIKPLCTSIVDLDDKIYAAQQTKQLYYYKVTNLGSAEVVYKKCLTELIDSTKKYYKFKNSSEIDKMATSYILGFGLSPVDLKITMPDGNVNEAPYKYSVLPERQAAPVQAPAVSPTANKNKKGNSTASFVNPESLMNTYLRSRLNEDDTTRSDVKCVPITIVVSGDAAKGQKMLDDLCTKPSLRLTGFSWSDTNPVRVQHEDGTYEMVDSGIKILKVDLNFYMAEYPEFEKEINKNAESGQAAAEG